VIGLKRRQRALERFVERVSSPSSPNYRHFATPAEIDRRYGASAGARGAVLRYLRRRGHHASIGPDGAFAETTVPVAAAQRLFRTRLGTFRARDGARFLAPVRPPHLPAPLRPYVTVVLGLDGGRLKTEPRSPAVRPGGVAAAADAGVGSGYAQRTGTAKGCPAGLAQPGFAPNQYRRAYGYPGRHRLRRDGAGQRVALISIAPFRRSDITTFASCFGLRAPPTRVIEVTGRPAPPGPSELEATLDVEMVSAAAPGLRSVDVYQSPETPAGLVRQFAEPLHRGRPRPNVLSTSIVSCEPNWGGALGAVRLIDHAIAADSAAGVSVLAAAGDTGSSGCALGVSNGGALGILAAAYPASSPNVTGVGGTNLRLDSANRLRSEALWNDEPQRFSAGGGARSLLFGRPRFQRLSGIPGPARSTPDVAMLADPMPGYLIYCTAAPICPLAAGQPGGGFFSTGGTSAASPLLAGGIARADQRAGARGEPPLGALNPLIYQLGRKPRRRALHDIRRGSNDLGAYIPSAAGGGAPLGCCKAKPGYDGASGWGSIDIAAFSRAALRAGGPRHGRRHMGG